MSMGRHPANSPIRSNLHRMISIKKLYKEGKMYMSEDEMGAIQRGQLNEYLL